MGWTRVEDRIPTETKRFLVKVQRPSQMRPTAEFANRYLHKPAVCDEKLDVNFLIHGLVTHWMEIPE